MDFRKDEYETSMRASHLTPSLTSNRTTAYPTAISKPYDNDSDSKDPAEASGNPQPGRQDTGKVENHDALALNVVKRSDQFRLTHTSDLTAVSKGWEKSLLFAILQQRRT